MINGDMLVIAQKKKDFAAPVKDPVTLVLVGQPDGDKTQLTLSAIDSETGQVIATLTHVLMVAQV